MKTFQSLTVSINHRWVLLCSIICLSTLLYSCKDNNSVSVDSDSFLELYYLAPNRNYPMQFSCSPLKSGPLPSDSERFYLKITDKTFMNKFYSAYSVLKATNNNENINFDARTQILLHLKNRTDTICMSKNSGIIVNGNLMQDSTDFFKLVNEEVGKNYNPRLKK